MSTEVFLRFLLAKAVVISQRPNDGCYSFSDPLVQLSLERKTLALTYSGTLGSVWRVLRTTTIGVSVVFGSVSWAGRDVCISHKMVLRVAGARAHLGADERY